MGGHPDIEGVVYGPPLHTNNTTESLLDLDGAHLLTLRTVLMCDAKIRSFPNNQKLKSDAGRIDYTKYVKGIELHTHLSLFSIASFKTPHSIEERL